MQTICTVTPRSVTLLIVTHDPAEQSERMGTENGTPSLRHGRVGDALSHTQHRLSVQEHVQPVCKNEGIQGSTKEDSFIDNHNKSSR